MCLEPRRLLRIRRYLVAKRTLLETARQDRPVKKSPLCQAAAGTVGSGHVFLRNPSAAEHGPAPRTNVVDHSREKRTNLTMLSAGSLVDPLVHASSVFARERFVACLAACAKQSAHKPPFGGRRPFIRGFFAAFCWYPLLLHPPAVSHRSQVHSL